MIFRSPEHKEKMRAGYLKYVERKKAEREAQLAKQAAHSVTIVNVAEVHDAPKVSDEHSPSSSFAGAAGPIIERFLCSCGRSLSLRQQTRPTAFQDFSGAGTRFRFYCAACHFQYNVNVVQQNGVARPK